MKYLHKTAFKFTTKSMWSELQKSSILAMINYLIHYFDVKKWKAVSTIQILTCFVNSPIVNILDNLTGLWSARQHLHMVCHKSTHILIKRLWNCVLTPPSVSVWRPAPPSWLWGWCPSVYSFIPPCGQTRAPSKSHLKALVSSQQPFGLTWHTHGN